jgi:hypothetical protein
VGIIRFATLIDETFIEVIERFNKQQQHLARNMTVYFKLALIFVAGNKL